MTSRDIGRTCIDWARSQMPKGFELVEDPEKSDIFISVLYEHLVSEAFIERRHACFNFHPGILPHYRGSGAYSWVLINEEKQTGVTLHKLDVDIDSGSIIDIGTFPIEGWDTAESLFKKAEQTILTLFKTHFDHLLKGDYHSYPQATEGKIYYRKDLQKVKDLTKFLKAFSFTGKESSFYIKRNGEKVYLQYD